MGKTPRGRTSSRSDPYNSHNSGYRHNAAVSLPFVMLERYDLPERNTPNSANNVFMPNSRIGQSVPYFNQQYPRHEPRPHLRTGGRGVESNSFYNRSIPPPPPYQFNGPQFYDYDQPTRGQQQNWQQYPNMMSSHPPPVLTQPPYYPVRTPGGGRHQERQWRGGRGGKQAAAATTKRNAAQSHVSSSNLAARQAHAAPVKQAAHAPAPAAAAAAKKADVKVKKIKSPVKSIKSPLKNPKSPIKTDKTPIKTDKPSTKTDKSPQTKKSPVKKEKLKSPINLPAEHKILLPSKSVAPPSKKINTVTGLDNKMLIKQPKIPLVTKNKLQIKKRRTIDIASMKVLSIPVKNTRRLSVATIGNRKSINNSVKSESVKKIDLIKKNIKSNDKELVHMTIRKKIVPFKTQDKKSNIKVSKLKETTQKIKSPVAEVSKKAKEASSPPNTLICPTFDSVSPLYYTPNSSPSEFQVKTRLTRGKSCAPLSADTDKPAGRQARGKSSPRAPLSSPRQTRGKSSPKTATNIGSEKSVDVAIKASFERVKKSSTKLSSAATCTSSEIVNTRRQSRFQSNDNKSESKRKRSTSEAPSASPTSKKPKQPPSPSQSKHNLSESSSTNSQTDVQRTPRRQALTSLGNPKSRRSQPATPRGQHVTPRGEQLTPRSQQSTPRSQQVTPRSMRSSNRGVMMVQAVLDQQAAASNTSQHSPKTPKGLWQIGPSVAVQTVDPEDIVSDFQRVEDSDESSGEEEDEDEEKRTQFMSHMVDFKRSLDNRCSVM